MMFLGSINICGIDYALEERAVDEDRQLGDCYAYVDHTIAKIVIRSGLPKSLFRSSIYHEIQHCIWEHSGLRELDGNSPKFEEAFIQIFTSHWIAAVASVRKWNMR